MSQKGTLKRLKEQLPEDTYETRLKDIVLYGATWAEAGDSRLSRWAWRWLPHERGQMSESHGS
jgi:hypothetical protein